MPPKATILQLNAPNMKRLLQETWHILYSPLPVINKGSLTVLVVFAKGC